MSYRNKLLTVVSAVVTLGFMFPAYGQSQTYGFNKATGPSGQTAPGEKAGAGPGVSYISGGVGDDSRDRMNSMARDYNLRVMFTLNEGNFLSAVNVTVTDARGNKVIQDVTEGPFLMAKVPAGAYTVTATNDGKTQTRKMQVGAKGGQVVHMRWAANPQTDSPVARDQAGPGKQDLTSARN